MGALAKHTRLAERVLACPHLMLVISFLMESETVREWLASTDHCSGSLGQGAGSLNEASRALQHGLGGRDDGLHGSASLCREMVAQ